MRLIAGIVGIVIAAVAPQAGRAQVAADASVVAEIQASALDYVDGQLEGDPKRVARALHPELAKRAVAGDGPTGRQVFPLVRMSSDELVRLTHEGAIKTPRERWSRTVKVLDVAGNIAAARVETPWFVDQLHLGRFGDRWLIINALWWPKPQAAQPVR